MKKVLLALIVSLGLLGVYQVSASGTKTNISVVFNKVNLFLDGEKQQLTKPAIVYDGTTYLPIRDIGVITGKDVTWDGNTNSIYLDVARMDIQGEAVYQSSCASCHGTNLEGNIAPSLYTVGKRLSTEEIKDVILSGKGSMPPMLSDEKEAETLALWLSKNYN